MNEQRFDIEAEFVKYMQRMKLDITIIDLPELSEYKRAFFAGLTQLVLYLTHENNVVKDIDTVLRLQDIQQQLSPFWKNIGFTKERMDAAGRS